MISFCTDKPYCIDIRSLWNSTGLQEHLLHTIITPARIGLDMIGLPVHSPLSCDLTIFTLAEGMKLKGHISGVVSGECVRCLAPLSYQLQAPVNQLFEYDWKDDEQHEEQYPLQDYVMDIEQAVITFLIDQLPLSPLCFLDCKGLCSHCGQDLNEKPEHNHEYLDPRFSSLAQFFS